MISTPGRCRAIELIDEAHALGEAEEQAVVDLCNRSEYQDLPPAQIVAQEADAGRYWASESTMYRVLRKHQQAQPRGRGRKGATPSPPTSHRADGPNQVWSWDTTWLPGPVVGLFFYLVDPEHSATLPLA